MRKHLCAAASRMRAPSEPAQQPAPVCNDGKRGVCKNDGFRCLDDTLQTCAAGDWKDVRVCADGSCKASTGSCGVCSEGTHQCSGQASETCVRGVWISPVPCGGVSCSTASGVCGECVSGIHQCSAAQDASRSCNDGRWSDFTSCGSFGCMIKKGLCGECQGGAHRCSGNTSQVCTDGAWSDERPCGSTGCIAASGLCAPDDGCGGGAGLACSSGMFCNYEPAAGGDGCNVTNGWGKCQTKPEVCTADFTPVCGCNVRGYSNACRAHAAGVSIAHSGSCTDVDCRAIGGVAVDVASGSAPNCSNGGSIIGSIVHAVGPTPANGTVCCL